MHNEAVASVNSRFVVMTEEEILRMLTFLQCVALSPSLYPNTIILFNLGETVAFKMFTQVNASHTG